MLIFALHWFESNHISPALRPSLSYYYLAGLNTHFIRLMKYNTKRERLIMPEYGRNIQQMVDYMRKIEDPVKRQKNAKSIIELMGVLNPHLKNVEDFRHKLWDHLYLIADFDLEVESPYPTPTKEKLFRKPQPLPYPKIHRKQRHLGKNLSVVIEKALAETNEEKRRGFTQSIAYYMKLAYANWHREPMHDDMIKEELLEITNGALNYTSGGIKVRFDNNKQGGPSAAHGHKKNMAGNNAGANRGNAQNRNGASSRNGGRQNNNNPKNNRRNRPGA